MMITPAPATHMAKRTPRIESPWNETTFTWGWASVNFGTSYMVVEKLGMHLRLVGDVFFNFVFPEGPVVVEPTKYANWRLFLCSEY